MSRARYTQVLRNNSAVLARASERGQKEREINVYVKWGLKGGKSKRGYREENARRTSGEMIS